MSHTEPVPESRWMSRLRTHFKYGYLIGFFMLLSGFFYPLIHSASFDAVMFGLFVLFTGLAGSIMLYKAAVTQSMTYLAIGGMATFMTLMMIMAI